MPPKVLIKIKKNIEEPAKITDDEPSLLSDIIIGPFKLIPAGNNSYFITGGNTYSIKEDLKTMSCTWNKAKASWWIPSTKFEEVKKYLTHLVSIANKKEPSKSDDKRVSELILTPDTKIKTFNELMTDLNVSDIKNITTLSAKEIDYLISILTMHDGLEKLSDKVEQMKIQLVIETLGGKLCRCIKKIVDKGDVVEKAAIPICISSIFVKKGLKISTFQCKNGELLLPISGSKTILDRQPDKKSII